MITRKVPVVQHWARDRLFELALQVFQNQQANRICKSERGHALIGGSLRQPTFSQSGRSDLSLPVSDVSEKPDKREQSFLTESEIQRYSFDCLDHQIGKGRMYVCEIGQSLIALLFSQAAPAIALNFPINNGRRGISCCLVVTAG